MKLIALLHLAEGQSPQALAPFAVAESHAVWEQVKTGIIRAVHYRTDKPGAVLEMESPDLETARAIASALPAVQASIIELTDLIPLAPYTGFEALFTPSN
jgi:hypothetical protein